MLNESAGPLGKVEWIARRLIATKHQLIVGELARWIAHWGVSFILSALFQMDCTSFEVPNGIAPANYVIIIPFDSFSLCSRVTQVLKQS